MNKAYQQELSKFLKRKRTQLLPEQVGFPSQVRRRTQGLRREEVAQLAGISVTWYTWLEQGRDIRVSTDVLDSIARVLRLTEEERDHLFLLAHHQRPPQKPSVKETVSPTLQTFIDSLTFIPAHVIGQRWDLLAWNKAATLVFGDFETMSIKERNLVYRIFTFRDYRDILEDWAGHAQRLLAQFRAGSSQFIGDAWFQELIDELNESSQEFRDWWPLYQVMGIPEGCKKLNHPILGRLEFEHITLQTNDFPSNIRINIYLPKHGTSTANILEKALRQSESQ